MSAGRQLPVLEISVTGGGAGFATSVPIDPAGSPYQQAVAIDAAFKAVRNHLRALGKEGGKP